jgi:hypothetical protein
MALSTAYRGSADGQVGAVRLLGLLAAGVAVFGSVVGDAFMAVYVASGFSALSLRFAGWQVDAAEVAGGAIWISLTVVSVMAFRRQWRATPVGSRRLSILLAVLPGLAIGACLSDGTHAAITWAGNHTAQAASARAAVADYRISPPPMPVSGPPADPALTPRMLTTSDLGAGWYYGIQPDAVGVAVTPEARSQGQISQARTVLNQQHWTGSAWALDRIEIERITQFDSSVHATAYLAAWRLENTGSKASTSNFGKVPVAILTTKSADLVAFIVGDDVVNLSVGNSPSSQTENLNAVIVAAIDAASPTS